MKQSQGQSGHPGRTRELLQSSAAADSRHLDLLRTEEAAAGRTPPNPPDDSDYFVECANPDQVIGASEIARWKFRLEIVTDADRKKVYYENSVWGEEAGYHRVGKNRLALSKSKYRAFRARMNGGAS